MKNLLRIDEKQAFGFELMVKNDRGTEIPMEICGEESRENSYVFRACDVIYNTTVKVELVKKENSAYVRMCGDIKTPEPWEKSRQFAAYDSMVLKLYPQKDTEKIFGSYFSVGYDSDCWVSPYFGNSFSEVKRSVSLLWKQEDVYYHMIPLCDGDFKAEIKNIDHGMAVAAAPFCSGFNHIDCKCVIISWGDDPYKVREKNVAFGFEVLGKRNSMRKNTRLSDVFNYLGWCSWDSMNTKVSSEKFYEKAEEFKQKNIPVKWMLVDYGWYQVTDESMEKQKVIDFKEDKNKFPEGRRNMA